MTVIETGRNEFSSVGIIYDHIGCTPTLTLPRKRGRGLRGTGGGKIKAPPLNSLSLPACGEGWGGVERKSFPQN